LEIAYPLSGKRPEPPPNRKPESAEELTTADARIVITVETRSSHANAVERLAQIASEESVRPQLLVIAGWPAIHRQLTTPLPQPGETDSPRSATGIVTTTAIAVNVLVVRFETALAPQANPALAQAALQIAQQAHVQPGNAQAAQRDLDTLAHLISTQPANPPSNTPRNAASSVGGTVPLSTPGTSTVVQTGAGELEMVISEDGVHVVIAANSGYAYSDNRGVKFTYVGGTPCIFNGCDGDPSLAIGKSGAVYYSWIGFPNKQPGGIPPNGTTDSLSISKNNGHSFTFLSNAVVCPSTTPAVCTTPDQEHIAADRKTLSKVKKDRVYLVWRNFSNVRTTPRIVCSINGGQTWSAQTTIGTGDFPRITVGGDGFVYTVYTSGSNILLNKFSACDSGLVPQTGFPSKVASYTLVACPVPGLDRCDNGNILSSQMVAVDDTNPAHVYVAFATNTAPTNDDIMVYDSFDGGVHWGVPVRANKAVAGRRFMPWVCAAGGIASVTWYDRRAATPAADDLTAYYQGSAKRVTPPGVLEANPEVNISGVNDPQCASGWAGGERSPADAASCSTPQLAGKCQLPCANTKAGCPGGITGSNTPCYFAKGPNLCTAPTETCQVWGGGSPPKYGDYNGNACALMQLQAATGASFPAICAAWASATPPKGTGGSQQIQIYASCNSIDSTAPPVTITYHQVGACNGYAGPFGLVTAGKNFAYVLFGIESIDNSLGSGSFAFNPANLYYQQATEDLFDPSLALYKDILGPFAAIPTAVPAGDDLKFSVSAEGALIVSTTNPNGAVEANATSYFLLYNRQPGDPPVKLVKSDASQKSWPLTEDCHAILLH
jgi:hypothetical protein